MNVDSLILQKTDLDLNTSGALPEAAIDVGLGPDSLSAATRAALKTGYQTDVESDTSKPSPYGDGTEDTVQDMDVFPSPPAGGFLGRPTGMQR